MDEPTAVQKATEYWGNPLQQIPRVDGGWTFEYERPDGNGKMTHRFTKDGVPDCHAECTALVK